MRFHVVIISCGFGGLFAARALRGVPLEVTVVDRVNHHLFQPLLYQVATAGLSAPAIAAKTLVWAAGVTASPLGAGTESE